MRNSLHSNCNHLKQQLLELTLVQLARYFVKEIKQSRNPAQQTALKHQKCKPHMPHFPTPGSHNFQMLTTVYNRTSLKT